MKKIIRLNNKKNNIIELFLKNIQEIFDSGYMDCMENLEIIDENRINDDHYETIRRFKSKGFLPQFIDKMIPENRPYLEYYEYAKWGLKENVCKFHYKPIEEYYKLTGELSTNTQNDVITIVINFDLLKNIPLKSFIENTVNNLIIDRYVKIIKRIDQDFHNK